MQTGLIEVKRRLPPEEQRFLDDLDGEETQTLLEILEARGADYVVGTWGHLRKQVEYIRSL